MNSPKIKICGITQVNETEYLNEAKIDYAGFVFFPPSKRNVSLETARELMTHLSQNIKKVAVTVSPKKEEIEKIQGEDFDILQVHKELSEDVLNIAKIPIWYAINIEDEDEYEAKMKFIDDLPENLRNKIEAIVVDAKDFGSGRPFNWSKSKRLKKAGAQSPPKGVEPPQTNEEQQPTNRKFVLAGGLREENVRSGIDIFAPDIVDVSSGVEGADGKKDREKILSFVQAVREKPQIKILTEETEPKKAHR